MDENILFAVPRESYGIRLALEVHAPHLLTGEWVQRNLDLVARKNTRHLGLMPDLGTFCKRIPRLAIAEALREGATPRIVDYPGRHEINAEEHIRASYIPMTAVAKAKRTLELG